MRPALRPALMFVVLSASAGCNDSPLEPDAMRPQFNTEEDCEATGPESCENGEDVPFEITAAYVQYVYVPREAESITRTTHNASFGGSVTMTRNGTSGSWKIDISSDGGWRKEHKVRLDASAPCSLGEGPVTFAGVHTAIRTLFEWDTATRTSGTYLDLCGERQRREEVRPGSGGGSEEPVDEGYTECLVEIWYWKDTGEVISMEVLYCW